MSTIVDSSARSRDTSAERESSPPASSQVIRDDKEQHGMPRHDSFCGARDVSATAAGEGSWTGAAKTTTVVNGLTFRSNFDSGNLMKVILPAEQGGVGGVYQMWTARDCEGGPNIRRNSSWFHFGVAGASAQQLVTMRLMNLNNQSTLYKHGMTPVFRQASDSQWARLKQKVTVEERGRHLELQFCFRFVRDSEEVFFAFCFPYSYEDCQRDLERCEDQARRDGLAVQAMLTPPRDSTGYYHRELLVKTPEGRRVDLITVTDCQGILDEREADIDPHILPDSPTRRRPFEFEGKDVVFVSARVHPGETPASFVFQGILRFLLDSGDPRAAELRRRFVFKLVPLLNPDGVAAGHFRQDPYGNNLNRHYESADSKMHAPVYASKAIVMHHAVRPAGRGRLQLYLDLHAHASSRGCFIYGNHHPRLEDQVENQLLPILMTLNTPHFDYSSCNFSLKHMSRVDSGDGGLSAEGTGRVYYGKKAGLLRSYTLECNYNTGKAMCNRIPPAHGARGGRFASPERQPAPAPRYHPEVWRDVGRGFLKALLDAHGASVWSRLPQSKYGSLERVRRCLTNELRSQPSYREQSLLLRRAATSAKSSPLPPPPDRRCSGPVSSPPIPSSRGEVLLQKSSAENLAGAPPRGSVGDSCAASSVRKEANSEINSQTSTPPASSRGDRPPSTRTVLDEGVRTIRGTIAAGRRSSRPGVEAPSPRSRSGSHKVRAAFDRGRSAAATPSSTTSSSSRSGSGRSGSDCCDARAGKTGLTGRQRPRARQRSRSIRVRSGEGDEARLRANMMMPPRPAPVSGGDRRRGRRASSRIRRNAPDTRDTTYEMRQRSSAVRADTRVRLLGRGTLPLAAGPPESPSVGEREGILPKWTGRQDISGPQHTAPGWESPRRRGRRQSCRT